MPYSGIRAWKDKPSTVDIAQTKYERHGSAGKVRLKPLNHHEALTSILCNDTVTWNWMILKRKHPCSRGHRTLFEDVKSWIKEETRQELDDENLAYWNIYDIEGHVDPTQERALEHQDHFANFA
jgi:hypothetical protein